LTREREEQQDEHDCHPGILRLLLCGITANDSH